MLKNMKLDAACQKKNIKGASKDFISDDIFVVRGRVETQRTDDDVMLQQTLKNQSEGVVSDLTSNHMAASGLELIGSQCLARGHSGNFSAEIQVAAAAGPPPFHKLPVTETSHTTTTNPWHPCIWQAAASDPHTESGKPRKALR